MDQTATGVRPPAYTLSRETYDGVIFDLDGVVTRTASIHFAAWKRLFDEWLRRRAEKEGEEFKPFTEKDYLDYVDGKPRYDGVESFLESRGVSLPYGEPDDPPEKETVVGLGNCKNLYFREELKKKKPEVYASSIRLIEALRGQGFKIGLVSSSKNALTVIRAAGIDDCFDAKVDGVDLESIRLPGKPAPDMYLMAAEALGVEPGRAVVVEDARAGVEAGSRGGFGLVIGVAREGNRAELLRSGADLAVTDLAEIGSEGELLPTMFSTAALASALDRFTAVSAMIENRRPVVFLDYDGTLTPIVRHPREAVISQSMRLAIRRLAAQTTVALISGRDLTDIRNMVQLDGIYYAGSHGFDIAGPGGGFALQKGENALPALEKAGRELESRVAGLNGVWVEHKKFALAVHFREATDDAASQVEPAVDEVLAGHSGLKKSGGKKILELRPDIEWDKGRAIAWLLDRLDLDRPEVLPVYLGDDLTDEDAFRELQSRGLGIVVRDGERPTAARYALDDTGQVRTFLEKLAGHLEQKAEE
ncbi:MAG: trehalose-phosphatase [Deltaproteobacteria bacterium]